MSSHFDALLCLKRQNETRMSANRLAPPRLNIDLRCQGEKYQDNASIGEICAATAIATFTFCFRSGSMAGVVSDVMRYSVAILNAK